MSLSGVGLGAGQSVTFTLDSASGTATEGIDFSALLAGGLTAAAGIVLTTSTGAGGAINVTATNTTAADLATGAALLSFTIATTPDAVVEGPENFTVTLASATATVVNPNDHDQHYGRRPPGDPAGWSGVGCGRRRDRALHGEPEWCWAWCRPERDVYA